MAGSLCEADRDQYAGGHLPLGAIHFFVLGDEAATCSS